MQHSLVSVFTPSLMSAEDLEHIFVQREPLAQDLIKRIVNSSKGRGKEHSLLIGMRGMGKTHLVSLVYYRVKSIPELQEKLLIAWLREEEWGVDSWLDLVMRILRAVAEDRSSADSGVAQDLLDRLRKGGFESAKGSATQFLRDFIGKRTLLLIIENMDDLFEGLKETGQQEFRAFLQEYRCCTVLATTPAMFSGVSSRKEPFFGFFHHSYLEPIEVDEAVKMLGQIASLNTVRDDRHALAIFLQSAQGRARVRAVHHLAGGNPRVYTLFAQFMTRESLDELVDAFMKMLDDLTPYYQSRMKDLSNQQRKIMELLIDRRQAVMVKEIGEQCFIDQRGVASQLRELKKKGYVVANEEGRESFYELSEVLMRFCLEVKKFRGRWMELVVDFLKVWYRPDQRQGMLEKFGDSKLIARHDLERAFLSNDDLVGDICIREFARSLKEQNRTTVLQIAEELQVLAIITNKEYEEFVTLVGKEEYAKALKLLERTKSGKNQEHQPATYFQLFAEGLLLQMEEKWLEAIASYDQAVAINPDFYDTWNNQGYALDELGRYEEAIASYDQAVAINPDFHDTWNNRGNSLANLGRYEEAIASYDQAVAINPDFHEAWYNRGVSLANLDRYEEAIVSYDQAVAINPDFHKAWNNRGYALDNLGRYEEAIVSYDEAVAINPDFHKAWHNRGYALDNLGRYKEAIASYDRSVDINPFDHKAWNNRGVSLGNLGRYEEAIASFDRVLAINPDDRDAWNNRGVSLGNLGRYEEAIASFELAVDIKPDFCEAWINKGYSYFKWGKYPESIVCYDRAIAINPDQYISWHYKGLVQFVTSDYQATLSTWQQAFSHISNPEVPRFQENISGLIQEFIAELISRFTQPPIQQTLLIPLLAIYKEAKAITELGVALVNTLHLLVAPSLSDHTAAQWLELWRTSSLGNEPAMELPLRLMETAIAYKKDPSKRQRLWLNLPSEERPILDKALRLSE